MPWIYQDDSALCAYGSRFRVAARRSRRTSRLLTGESRANRSACLYSGDGDGFTLGAMDLFCAYLDAAADRDDHSRPFRPLHQSVYAFGPFRVLEGSMASDSLYVPSHLRSDRSQGHRGLEQPRLEQPLSRWHLHWRLAD